jgi:hypothetical protein
MFLLTGVCATVLGVTYRGNVNSTNEEREKTALYVEKLERERESLVQDVIKNNPNSR